MESKITAARQIDQLRAHQLDTLGAGALEAVHGLEHERNDGRESKHDQSGADAEVRETGHQRPGPAGSNGTLLLMFVLRSTGQLL